ncbi:hypothetical protein GCM10023083_21680 [Streptomyces phyllanthi]
MADGERGDDMHDTADGAPGRRGGAPSAPGGHQRGRDEQHEQEQQVIGALADVLDAQARRGGEAPQPRALARRDLEALGRVVEDPEGLGVVGLEDAAVEVVADGRDDPVGQQLLDDDVVAQPEVGDLAVGRTDCERVDEVRRRVDRADRRRRRGRDA